nr:unnamed protein product [Haemonchus contortus]
MDKPSFEDLRKKRKAQEQKLIEDLKYKRSCIRTAPTLPSEKEVQKKIRTFVKQIIRITRTNDALDTFTKVQGSRPVLYARREATLYRAKVENVWTNTSHMKECFRSAAESLAMCYETYKLLMVAESASKKSRDKFFAEDVEGLNLDPTITSDYVRKEMDFFDEIMGTMETELKNAEIQISNEDHPNAMAELKQMIINVQACVDSAVSTLQQQEKEITELFGLARAISEETRNIRESQRAIEEHLSALEERKGGPHGC